MESLDNRFDSKQSGRIHRHIFKENMQLPETPVDNFTVTWHTAELGSVKRFLAIYALSQDKWTVWSEAFFVRSINGWKAIKTTLDAGIDTSKQALLRAREFHYGEMSRLNRQIMNSLEQLDSIDAELSKIVDWTLKVW